MLSREVGARKVSAGGSKRGLERKSRWAWEELAKRRIGMSKKQARNIFTLIWQHAHAYVGMAPDRSNTDSDDSRAVYKLVTEWGGNSWDK